MEYYYTLEKYSKTELKIKRSIFICHLTSVETIAEAKNFISEINSQYKTANHNCWAYVIGKNADVFHSSDAGEPSGTAGQPMLNTLKKYKLSNVAAVVTRYFGGVKLGVRGLIEAYELSVKTGIRSTKLKKIVEKIFFSFSASYDLFNTIRYQVQKADGIIENEVFSEKVNLKISVEKQKSMFLENYFKDLFYSGKIEDLQTL